MDFSAKTGTPIYATGDGKVFKVSKSKRGYGNHVVIDMALDIRLCMHICQKLLLKETKR